MLSDLVYSVFISLSCLFLSHCPVARWLQGHFTSILTHSITCLFTHMVFMQPTSLHMPPTPPRPPLQPLPCRALLPGLEASCTTHLLPLHTCGRWPQQYRLLCKSTPLLAKSAPTPWQHLQPQLWLTSMPFTLWTTVPTLGIVLLILVS